MSLGPPRQVFGYTVTITMCLQYFLPVSLLQCDRMFRLCCMSVFLWWGGFISYLFVHFYYTEHSHNTQRSLRRPLPSFSSWLAFLLLQAGLTGLPGLVLGCNLGHCRLCFSFYSPPSSSTNLHACHVTRPHKWDLFTFYPRMTDSEGGREGIHRERPESIETGVMKYPCSTSSASSG